MKLSLNFNKKLLIYPIVFLIILITLMFIMPFDIALIGAIFITFIIFGLIYSSKLNKKNFKNLGVEYGSAKPGKKEEAEILKEIETYWIDGLSVCKEKFVSEKENYIKTKLTSEYALYKVVNKQRNVLSKEQFLNKKFVHEINKNGTTNNIILSKDLRLGFNQARRKNKNIIIVGGSGTGKTRFVVKPNLMQMNCNYFVTDPKGTILNEVGWMLEKIGKYKIKIFNTINFTQSLKYNPLAYIEEEKDVLVIVDVLIANTTGTGEKQDFWVKAEKLLYQALIAFLWKYALPAERNFTSVLKMLTSFEVREDKEDFKNAIDIMFDEIQAKYEEDCLKNPNLPIPYELSQYKAFKLAAGKTAKSILISCATRLAPFNIPQLAELTSKDELDLHLLGEERTALFVLVPDSDPTFNFIVAMMYTQMFNKLIVRADTKFGGKLPYFIHGWLDEFANIGEIPNFDKLIAVFRSRGISAGMILQAKSQLKAMYKDNAETIIGNCDTEIFLGGKEESTLKGISESLGKETIDTYNTGKTYSNSNSANINYSKVGKELVSINELKTMKDENCIVQIRGLNPFIKEIKYPIEEHPRYKYHAENPESKYWFNVDKYLRRYRKIIENNNLDKLIESQVTREVVL